MAWDIRFPQLAILAQESRADGVRRAAMKAARKSNDIWAASREARHPHRILITFSSRVAEKSFRERFRRNCDQLLRGSRARFRVNQVGIEKQLFCLLLNSLDHPRMRVTGAGHRMATVKVQVFPAVVGVKPNAFATLGDDWHFFIGRQL